MASGGKTAACRPNPYLTAVPHVNKVNVSLQKVMLTIYVAYVAAKYPRL